LLPRMACIFFSLGVSHHFSPMICDWNGVYIFYSRDTSFMSLIDSPLFVKFSKMANFNFQSTLWFLAMIFLLEFYFKFISILHRVNNWEFFIEIYFSCVFRYQLIYFFWSRISENKKNPNHDSRKLKFAIFENFTNNGESIRDINEVSRIDQLISKNAREIYFNEKFPIL
jgi:hypothetical protein